MPVYQLFSILPIKYIFFIDFNLKIKNIMSIVLFTWVSNTYLDQDDQYDLLQLS